VTQGELHRRNVERDGLLGSALQPDAGRRRRQLLDARQIDRIRNIVKAQHRDGPLLYGALRVPAASILHGS
jgi:hypothetical protein